MHRQLHQFSRTFLRLALAMGLALASVDTLAAAKPVRTQSLDRVLIVVDDSIITLNEVEARMRQARANLQRRNITMPPDAVIRRQVMDAMILEQIQLDLAKRRGIQATEPEVDRALANIARQNQMTLPAFLAKVKKDGISADALRDDVRKQLIRSKLVDNEINRQIHVSEGEVDNFLQEQNKRGADMKYDLSHIVVAVGESASSAERKRAAELAKQIREKLLAGESFEKLAITYSKGPNALKGGALGWREVGSLPDAFIKALESLTVGEITPVIESTNGYHILRLNNKSGGGADAVVTQTRVRHILLKPSEIQTIEQATSKLKRLRQRIVAGEKFEELARAYSEDNGSASQGGDLGWMSPGQLVGEFEQAMAHLKPGEVSQPVQTRFGVHLIQVVDRRSKDVGDEHQRLAARQQIHTRKADERLQQWLRELRDQAYVEVIPQETN
jgi:peptidyl-prolyl cis-trans isomerase SurA